MIARVSFSLLVVALFLVSPALAQVSSPSGLLEAIAKPPKEAYPETWFHLIGGNVSQPGITRDLEAIAGAGLQGFQLFHGRGNGPAWPGVSEPVECLSPKWDSLVKHIGEESQRLGLRFTMQNCPGWAMSGGPWIKPERAMRHLVWSRTDVNGGSSLQTKLPLPEPSSEAWRDYRDVCVLAFPTPEEDTGEYLVPTRVASNLPEHPWMKLFQGEPKITFELQPISKSPVVEPAWVELEFDQPTTLRTIEFAPTEVLANRHMFDPATKVVVTAFGDDQAVIIMDREIPRGTWQDSEPNIILSMSASDQKAKRFRITFENRRSLKMTHLRVSSAARVHNWRGQAGYALRSLDRTPLPNHSPKTFVPSKSIVELTSKVNQDGLMEWNAPVGKWTIVRYGHVNTGAKNKPAPPEATGFECDKLSPLGAEQHFAGYVGRLTRQGAPIEKSLDGMLIDSWECFTQTWTPNIDAEFLQRRGYALRQWLPALSGWVVEDHATSEKFLRDWRATVNDLLVDNYFGQLASLAKERGLQLYFETAIGDISPGDILQYYSKADIPMCEFWQPNDPHFGGLETKPIAPTTSAAHLYGKNRIAAEAFTNLPMDWNEHPGMLKHMADRHFALGVNHLVFHTYTHNPSPDTLPGTSFGSQIGTPFLRGQTWWKAAPEFTTYLARCQAALQAGQPVADVLWYLGDDLDHKPRQDNPFPEGYHFDYCNHDILLNRLQVSNGELVTKDGPSWKVLWLCPETCQHLLPATVRRLKELVEQGAVVIGARPTDTPSLSGGPEALQAWKQSVTEIWGDAPALRGDRKLGLGRILWGDDLESSLRQLRLQPDVIGTFNDRWCHRRAGPLDLYFVTSDRGANMSANLTLRSRGAVQSFDPLTGKFESIPYQPTSDGRTAVHIELPAAGSLFIAVNRDVEASTPKRTEVYRNKELLFNVRDTTAVDNSTRFPNFGLQKGEPTQPPIPPPELRWQSSADGKGIDVFQDGEYRIVDSDGKSQTVSVSGTQNQALTGPWLVSFRQPNAEPQQMKLPSLTSWSELQDEQLKHFSGTATYRLDFQVDARNLENPCVLDLGDVREIAEVRLNGNRIQTLWTRPYRVRLSGLMELGKNELEVDVTNTWHNRLVQESAKPKEERKLWTTNFPNSNAPLKPSGWLGPARLAFGKKLSF